MALQGADNTELQEDFWGRTQLARLSFLGQEVDTARQLVDQAPGAVCQRGSSYNETPLLTAVSGGRASIDFLELLVIAGSDVSAVYAGGKNVLHCIANTANLGHLEFVNGLHKCPNVNSIMDNGNTPLHATCMQGTSTATISNRIEMARRLIELGAMSQITNRKGFTPAQEATLQGLQQVADFINSYSPEASRSYTPMREVAAIIDESVMASEPHISGKLKQLKMG